MYKSIVLVLVVLLLGVCIVGVQAKPVDVVSFGVTVTECAYVEIEGVQEWIPFENTTVVARGRVWAHGLTAFSLTSRKYHEELYEGLFTGLFGEIGMSKNGSLYSLGFETGYSKTFDQGAAIVRVVVPFILQGSGAAEGVSIGYRHFF